MTHQLKNHKQVILTGDESWGDMADFIINLQTDLVDNERRMNQVAALMACSLIINVMLLCILWMLLQANGWIP